MVCSSRLPALKGADAGEGLDIPGIALIASGVAALTYGVVQIEEAGFAPLVWAPALVGLGLLFTYSAWAKGRKGAAIDITLFADRTYTLVTVASFVFGIAFSMMFLSSFLFLFGVWGLFAGLTGLAVTLAAGGDCGCHSLGPACGAGRAQGRSGGGGPALRSGPRLGCLECHRNPGLSDSLVADADCRGHGGGAVAGGPFWRRRCGPAARKVWRRGRGQQRGAAAWRCVRHRFGRGSRWTSGCWDPLPSTWLSCALPSSALPPRSCCLPCPAAAEGSSHKRQSRPHAQCLDHRVAVEICPQRPGLLVARGPVDGSGASRTGNIRAEARTINGIHHTLTVWETETAMPRLSDMWPASGRHARVLWPGYRQDTGI